MALSLPLKEKLNRVNGALLERLPRAADFIVLARFNRPIGIYLLLWPTAWGLWFAAEGWPGWHLVVVFSLGVLLTRSAGCVINDIADRNFDAHVKRTVDRPITQGRISVEEAVVFMGVMLFAALLLVLTTNVLTVALAFIAALIAGLYPFMKRYTYLPQVILGVAFSMSIPMGFAAYQGEIPNLAWLLATANVVWTTAYDTEYAMVDRDDDLKLGLKSTAILFGEMDKLMIGMLQALFIFTLYLAGQLAEVGFIYYLGLMVASVLLAYQQYIIRDRERSQCLAAFLGNHWVGLTIFIGIALEFWLS